MSQVSTTLLLYICLLTTCKYIVDTEASLFTQIYQNLEAEPCVMVLTNNGIVGCDGPEDGAVAPLYLVRTQAALVKFTSSPPKEQQAIVLDPSLFSKETIDALAATGSVKGILLISDFENAGAPPDGVSSATTFPNQEWGLHSDSTHQWNPLGDGLNLASIPFPIFSVPSGVSDSIISFVQENMKAGAVVEENYPRWAVQFNSFMHGTKDVETCFRRGQCLPLGTKSVWSSTAQLGSKPIILAMANLDSNSIFHNQATGGESTVSGVVGLIAAAQALLEVDQSEFTSDIMFALWSGESWGYMGSRKFVDDIQNFKCEVGNAQSCAQPFKSSLAFQNIHLDKISAVVELNQIGVSSPSLYVHEESNANSNNLISVLTSVSNAANLHIGFQNVDNAAYNLPGIPPSSLMTFLQARANLPGVVITDYITKYANNYYHTHFDDGDHPPVNSSQLCDAATLVARSLYVLATGESPSNPNVMSINADCTLAATLLDCLTVDFNCALVKQFLPTYDLPTQASYYPSVFAYTITQQLATLPVKFLYDYMLNITTTYKSGACTKPTDCASEEDCILGRCTRGNTYYHDAVSPGIGWDYKTNKWIVVDNTQPLWAESNWDSTSVLFFQQDSPTNEGLFLAFGIVVLIGSFVAVYFYKRYFLRNYKIM